MSEMDEKTVYPSDQAERFQVRMPTGLRDRIARAASENGRSMNAEIVALLEAHYPPEPGPEEVAESIGLFMSMLAHNPTPTARYMLLHNIEIAKKAIEAEAALAKDAAINVPKFGYKWQALRETFARIAGDDNDFMSIRSGEPERHRADIQNKRTSGRLLDLCPIENNEKKREQIWDEGRQAFQPNGKRKPANPYSGCPEEEAAWEEGYDYEARQGTMQEDGRD